MQWIGQGLWGLVYYSTVAVVVTAVYGAKGTKAAAPHVARATRWTGRNTVAGVQKLQNRIRSQKARSSTKRGGSGMGGRKVFGTGEVSQETPEERDRRNDEFRKNIVALGQIAQQRRQAGTGGSSSPPSNGSAARPASGPTVGSGSGASSSTKSGGSRMSNRNNKGQGGNGNGVSDVELFRRAKQALRPVAQLEPETAWELDGHFQAFADLLLFEAEVFSVYGETLDRRVGIDPRLVREYLQAVEAVTDAVQKLHRVRRRYRQMYKAAFEAAESGRVRMPSKAGFWSNKR